MNPSVLLCSVAALALAGAGLAQSEDKPCGPASLLRPAIMEYRYLDINTLRCTIASDGPYCDYRERSSAGLEWPQGTGKTAVYTAGLWIVGIDRPTDSLRTANMDYGSEYQPGPLLETFNTSTINDALPVSRADDPRYRIYKVEARSPDGDSARGVDPWSLWPGDLGAPYNDLNANGEWDAGTDQPRFYGDQQLWCVFNDVNVARHTSLGFTPPMGLEIQALYYAMDQPGVLENTMFMLWIIINKSDAEYDSVFLSLWSDTDLGYASDDLPACDTTLDLGYVFNGDNDDQGTNGYGATPPAVGFSYLQGPVVPSGAEDSARFLGRRLPGWRNLGLTAYLPSACGGFPETTCPPYGSPWYAPIAYAYLQGMMCPPLGYLKRPDSTIIRFWFSGDPVTGSGDVHENFPLGVWMPSDIYIKTSTGPFALAPGDTQEVVAALVLSQGTDRLHSVTVLKQDVAALRGLYESGIVVSVADAGTRVPDDCTLSQNYPNPFNPSTTIEFALPHSGFVTLKVYSVLGEDVATLVAGNHTAGTFTTTWDASGMPSGVYFYRLSVGEYVQTRKMVLMR